MAAEIRSEVLAVRSVLARIERAEYDELQQIMRAVERRYEQAFPEWDVVYIAMHKDPELRAKEMEETVKFLQKDLQWHIETQKNDSLG